MKLRLDIDLPQVDSPPGHFYPVQLHPKIKRLHVAQGSRYSLYGFEDGFEDGLKVEGILSTSSVLQSMDSNPVQTQLVYAYLGSVHSQRVPETSGWLW